MAGWWRRRLSRPRPTPGRMSFREAVESRPLIVCLGTGCEDGGRGDRASAGWSRSGGRWWRGWTTWNSLPDQVVRLRRRRCPGAFHQQAGALPKARARKPASRGPGPMGADGRKTGAVRAARSAAEVLGRQARPGRGSPRAACKRWWPCGRPAAWNPMPAAPLAILTPGGDLPPLAVPRLGRRGGRGRGPGTRSAAGDPHGPRTGPGRVSGRRPGPAAVEPLERRRAAGRPAAGTARPSAFRPSDEHRRRRDPRLQRHGRPAPQRSGSIQRRPPGALLDRGGPGDRLHPADRAGRLLLPPQDRRPDALDLAHLSGCWCCCSAWRPTCWPTG